MNMTRETHEGFEDAVKLFANAASLLWRETQEANGCGSAICADTYGENCHCNEVYQLATAQGIEARSGETRAAGLYPKGESPVPQGMRPELSNDFNIINVWPGVGEV